MEKVIITGANGFIGKALTSYLLQKDVQVYAIVRHSQNDFPIHNKKLKVIKAEFNEYPLLPNLINDTIDVFYHLAWDGVFGTPFKDYSLQLSNTKYSCDALMSAVQMNCGKFVMTGTVNELEVRKLLAMNECKPRYTCIYGTAKAASALIGKTLAYQNNIEFNEAILTIAYGPGDNSNMLPNLLIKSLLSNQRPKLVKGDHLYDWVFIGEIAKSLAVIGEKGKNFKTYYVGHNELRKFRDIVLEVRDIVNPDMELVFGEIADQSYLDYSKIDVDALYRDTGYKNNSNFKENILNTVEWIRSQTVKSG